MDPWPGQALPCPPGPHCECLWPQAAVGKDRKLLQEVFIRHRSSHRNSKESYTSPCWLRTGCFSVHKWAVSLVNKVESLGKWGELCFSKSQRLDLAHSPGRAQLPRWREVRAWAGAGCAGQSAWLEVCAGFSTCQWRKEKWGNPPLEECS